jgi:hypothetical protein
MGQLTENTNMKNDEKRTGRPAKDDRHKHVRRTITIPPGFDLAAQKARAKTGRSLSEMACAGLARELRDLGFLKSIGGGMMHAG